MRHRLRRLGWWFQRLNLRRALVLFVTLAGAVGVGWLYGGRDSAAFSGVLALVAGGLLGPRFSRLASRVVMRAPRWRTVGANTGFAGANLGYRAAESLPAAPATTLIDEIVESGGRFATGDVVVEAWVAAGDRSGTAWTIVQERMEPPAGRSVWTATVEGRLSIGDFDASGRPNPYRAAHRLVTRELDLPVVDIDLVSWGTEHFRGSERDVVVAIVRTSVEANELQHFDYAPDSAIRRRARPLPVTPDGLEQGLGRAHASEWRGGALLGLLELFEREHPGAWAAVEKRIANRWSAKAMFARVERGTEQVTGRALSLRR